MGAGMTERSGRLAALLFFSVLAAQLPWAAAAEFIRPPAGPQIDARQISLCAKTVWAESRSEPERGQLAVAFVIINRTHHPDDFAATISGVVQQSRQFSVWRQGSASRRRMATLSETDPTYRTARNLCLVALYGTAADPSG